MVFHGIPCKIENVGKTPAKIESTTIRYIRSRTHAINFLENPDDGPTAEFEMYIFPEMKDLTFCGKLEPAEPLTTAQIEAIENGVEFLFVTASSNIATYTGIRMRHGLVMPTKLKSSFLFK